MTKENVNQFLTDFIKNDECCDISHIKDVENQDLFSIGLDSLDKVELAIECEEKYSINIPDEDWDKLITINEISDYIINKVNMKNV